MIGKYMIVFEETFDKKPCPHATTMTTNVIVECKEDELPAEVIALAETHKGKAYIYEYKGEALT